MSAFEDDELFDDLPVDQRSCRLLGPTALVVQGMMGILVILSLIYKRHRETPKRPWRIWSFDVSKQVIGQMFVHGVNVLISGIVAHLSSGNACVLYFLNILIDTTLGVAIIYFILHLLTFFLTEKCGFKGYETGQYGTPPSLSYWFRQLAVYVMALTTMKLLVVALFAAWPGVFKLGEWLLSFLGSSDASQVIFTMGVFPIIMNIVQFWLIDSIVKAGAHSASVALPSDAAEDAMDPDQEPLFRASMDDDDDDDMQRHDIENPRPIRRSRSPSIDRSPSSLPDENKSSAATSVTASGSITPKGVEGGSQAIAMHAYPPSLGSSNTSPASSWDPSTRANSISPQPKRWRRSPPPPLSLQPRTPALIDSSHPDMTSGSIPGVRENNGDLHGEKEWAAWDDAEEDWADRVGEEDWTGRRLDAKQAAVRDAWTDHGRETSARISSR